MISKVLLVCLVIAVTSGNGEVITFDLSGYKPDDVNTHVYREFHNITTDFSEIKINNIGDNVGFIIVQVHSYLTNVTLSYNNSTDVHSKVFGTNIGLIYADNNSTALFSLSKNYNKTINVLVAITIHKDSDPVPGGCNLTFNNKVAPYQMVYNTDNYIQVDFQAPSGYGVDCNKNPIKITKYHLFMPENFKQETAYFSHLAKMITVEDIIKNGYPVRNYEGYYKYRTLFSSYKGTGEIFAVVATYNNASSAYIPAISYGCDYLHSETCLEPATTHWKYICAIYLIIGIFVCLFGHIFYKTSITLAAYVSGVLITYIVASQTNDFSFEAKSTTSLVLGLAYAMVWLFIWCRFGSPFVSTSLSFLLSGFLVASIVFYGIADYPIFRSDANYWFTFNGIISLTYMILWCFYHHGHILSCNFLGGYAAVVATTYYYNGYLHYILLNTIKRATVKNYNMAVVHPPYQVPDYMMTLLWISLFILGQYVHSKLLNGSGNAPFPPHSPHREPETENSIFPQHNSEEFRSRFFLIANILNENQEQRNREQRNQEQRNQEQTESTPLLRNVPEYV